ncbi:YceD family protein [Vannielia litorea]|uniref:Uncharacterized metal-binding protein YceD, DUF177 family n=1 Tax=Vannielia litorea TaxID=1217970 RepID=A0A1N6FAT0_9RHOB|nr:DUF177 domain-containing protein [Vannielia litorea]SIN92334.1 Uncharacterized metal-binding protein YceD, DUF177 family [Vannielia litorea]
MFRLSELTTAKPTTFELVPEAAALGRMADALGILGLRKLRFKGRLTPVGKQDWRLDAELGATVVQPCVVTLDPVTTRIEEPVTRRYLADFSFPEDDEVEMPEDDEAEPLPAVLDLGEVMQEALALALPAFPRAEGVELGEAVFTEPGAEPLTEESVKPFAGLADLKKRMED